MEINGKRAVVTMFILLAALLFFSGIATAETVRFEPSQTSLKPGETVTVDLVLAEAPGGLSGYRAVVTIDTPGVAEIAAATFPEWAEFTGAEGVPGVMVRLTGVDLNGLVEKNSRDVILATLTLKGISEGDVVLGYGNIFFDDDLDNRIIPDIANGSIVVSTLPAVTSNATSSIATTVPTNTTGPVPSITTVTASGGSGSSGASGSSSGSSGTAIIATTTPVTPALTGTTGPVTPNPSAMQTQDTAGELPPETNTPAITEAPVSENVDGPGIPFLTVPAIAAFLIVMALLAVWIRKREDGN